MFRQNWQEVGKMRRFLAIAAACLLLTGCGQNQVDAMISEPEQNGLLL